MFSVGCFCENIEIHIFSWRQLSESGFNDFRDLDYLDIFVEHFFELQTCSTEID